MRCRQHWLWSLADSSSAAPLECLLTTEGRDYTGHLNVTETGKPCKNWRGDENKVNNDVYSSSYLDGWSSTLTPHFSTKLCCLLFSLLHISGDICLFEFFSFWYFPTVLGWPTLLFIDDSIKRFVVYFLRILRVHLFYLGQLHRQLYLHILIN